MSEDEQKGAGVGMTSSMTNYEILKSDRIMAKAVVSISCEPTYA